MQLPAKSFQTLTDSLRDELLVRLSLQHNKPLSDLKINPVKLSQ